MATPVISSVQTGSETFNNTGTTTTVTSVTPANSVLYFTTSLSNQILSEPTTGVLTNGTTITWASEGHNNNVTVQWTLVEYSAGVSVQRGTIDPNTSTTATITAVTLAQSVLVPGGNLYDDNNYNLRAVAALELTNTTTVTWLGFDSAETNCGPLPYQIVEYDSSSDAVVQRGLSSIASAATSATVSVTAVSATADSMIVVSPYFVTGGSSLGSASPAEIGFEASFNSTTEIQIDRIGDPDDFVQFVWQVIELPSATSVELASVSMTTGETSSTDTITSVNTAKAFIFPQTWANFGGGLGINDSTQFDDFGCSMARFELTNSTTVTATRGTANDGGGTAQTYSGNAYVVEYDSGGGGDTTAPTYGTAPAIDGFTATTITVDATASDETESDVDHYAAVVADGAGAPSISQIKAGTGGGILSAGSDLSVTNAAEGSIALTGLSASTAYDIYYVISDGTNDSTATALGQTTAAAAANYQWLMRRVNRGVDRGIGG